MSLYKEAAFFTRSKGNPTSVLKKQPASLSLSLARSESHSIRVVGVFVDDDFLDKRNVSDLRFVQKCIQLVGVFALQLKLGSVVGVIFLN